MILVSNSADQSDNIIAMLKRSPPHTNQLEEEGSRQELPHLHCNETSSKSNVQDNCHGSQRSKVPITPQRQKDRPGARVAPRPSMQEKRHGGKIKATHVIEPFSVTCWHLRLRCDQETLAIPARADRKERGRDAKHAPRNQEL